MLITEIMQYLDASDVVTYAEDDTCNVFMGNLPSTPDIAVSVRPSGGFASDPKHGYDIPTVQIISRGDTDPRTAYTLAMEIYDVLQGLSSAELTSGGTWVVLCVAVQSEPADIGVDENGRYRFSQNYQFSIRRATSHRS